MYQNKHAADNAEKEFDKIFIKKEVPEDIPEYKFEKPGAAINILDLITTVNLAGSKGEARRLVNQGGVSIDGDKITDITATINITGEQILKVGKRKFIKLKI